jgi:hypothetical protein
MDYSLSFNRAVIDYASRNREHLLFNIYRMGQRSIQRGSEDTWTPSPSRINATTASDPNAWASLRRPEDRDPRGYIIPAGQPDFPTAVKFINALREVNVAVHRATAAFEVGGKEYAAGSFVVFTAQAFRPHVMDMFEPQDHPNVVPYPGAPPTAPYDNAGWTLAFQMGVQFDRILEPFSGPFEKVTQWNVKPPAGSVVSLPNTRAYTLTRDSNDAFRAVNRMLAAGERVSGGERFQFEAATQTRKRLESLAQELGLSFQAVGQPAGPPLLRRARIGLWDQYGGSMPSGWTRWILEQFEFPFSRVFPQELDAGNLQAKFDSLIFVDGAIPAPPTAGGGRGGQGGGRGGRGSALDPAQVPAEYRAHLGRVTPEQTIPRLREFVEAGGTVIAIGSSAENIVRHFKLPLEDHLVENGTPLPRPKYFVPGSVLTAAIDTRLPVTAGMPERVNVFFDNSPVFRRTASANDGVRTIATFDTDRPLKSGWAWGQQFLKGGIVAAEVRLGKGRVFLFGPEILHRAQPHGTFKLLFNALLQSTPNSKFQTPKGAQGGIDN